MQEESKNQPKHKDKEIKHRMENSRVSFRISAKWVLICS